MWSLLDHPKLLFTKSSLLSQGFLTENAWSLTDFTDNNSYKTFVVQVNKEKYNTFLLII